MSMNLRPHRPRYTGPSSPVMDKLMADTGVGRSPVARWRRGRALFCRFGNTGLRRWWKTLKYTLGLGARVWPECW